ncbi:MAG: hypothetical protein M3464_13725 [Chloroflexota bacterium]|nr:hypothetical protein [Chloroflexota bacterium]
MATIITNRRVRRPRATWRRPIRGVRTLTQQEGKDLFDYQARKELGISGDVFLARWDAGDYRCLSDWDEAQKVERLWMLIPFARRTPA